ncbi:MAG: metallophosphoesterase family protein [Gammaproteobacteria bacterium]|nr:metallophosphoesterase family protein [Gammaproteobacteria bacterium]
MNDSSSAQSDEIALSVRVSRLHLKQRLGIEGDREARVFGQGFNFFHIENWYSIHSLIRTILRMFLLHGRGRRNALDVEIRRNDIRIQSLPPSFNGFTILHISDLHLDMNEDIPRALIERIRDMEYDIVVLTGDFRAKTFGPYQPTVDAMERVRAHLNGSIYGVLGNHDSIRMVPSMEAMGIHMLLNESIVIERGGDRIFLAGIDDPHYYRADNLEKACDNIPPEVVSILLAHTPEIYKHASHADFNLMLCGHTHGGQICLPGRIPIISNARCPRRLCAGAWRYNDLIGYTSVGSGVSIVDVRLNCPPEITLHRLLSDSSA